MRQMVTGKGVGGSWAVTIFGCWAEHGGSSAIWLRYCCNRTR